MKVTITNNSKANQGVWTDEGLVHIEPGQTIAAVIAKDYEASTKRLPFLSIRSASDPLDHDGDGVKGGVANPSPLSPGEEADLIDAMNEDELRDFIERKTGAKPHKNAKLETLIEKAKVAAAD